MNYLNFWKKFSKYQTAEPQDNAESLWLAETFARLPRKPVPFGQKESVWLNIQNQMRNARAEIETSPKLWGILPAFRFRKLAVTALALAIAVSGGVGISRISENSLPGDTLYTVKRATENVEQALAPTDTDKVAVQIKHAKTRLQEVQTLITEKNPDSQTVTNTLQALQTTTEQVVTAASAAPPDVINSVTDLIAQETQILDQVKTQVQGEVQQAVQAALATSLQSIDKLKNDASSAGKVEGMTFGNGNSSTTPALLPPLRPPRKPADGVLQTHIQLQGVTKTDQPTNSKPTEPHILSEPSVGF